MPDNKGNVLSAFCLPLSRDKVAAMPWSRRVRLFARFLEIQVRLFPFALPRCC
jgi:hypothetical protein